MRLAPGRPWQARRVRQSSRVPQLGAVPTQALAPFVCGLPTRAAWGRCLRRFGRAALRAQALRGQPAGAALLLRRLRCGVPSPGPRTALSTHGPARAPSLATATRRRFQVALGWQGAGRPRSASRFWLAAMRTSRSASYAFCGCIRAPGQCMQTVRAYNPTRCYLDLPLHLRLDSTASSNWPATLKPFRFGKSFSARAAS